MARGWVGRAATGAQPRYRTLERHIAAFLRNPLALATVLYADADELAVAPATRLTTEDGGLGGDALVTHVSSRRHVSRISAGVCHVFPKVGTLCGEIIT